MDVTVVNCNATQERRDGLGDRENGGQAVGREIAPVVLVDDAVIVEDKNSLGVALSVECLPEGAVTAMMRFIVEVHGVNPVGTPANGKLKSLLAVGNGIDFALLEAEDIGIVLAISPQAPDNGARRH